MVDVFQYIASNNTDAVVQFLEERDCVFAYNPYANKAKLGTDAKRILATLPESEMVAFLELHPDKDYFQSKSFGADGAMPMPMTSNHCGCHSCRSYNGFNMGADGISEPAQTGNSSGQNGFNMFLSGTMAILLTMTVTFLIVKNSK